MFKRSLCVALCVAATSIAAAHAQQSFTATVDGKPFESDNDGITVVPTKTSVSISARTKGFGGYPPPKGFSNRFAIICPIPKAPVKYPTEGSGGFCTIQWTVAERGLMDADYKTTPNEGEFVSRAPGAKDGYVNISKVAGKNIEGDFSAELVDAKTKKKVVVSGKFKGIDGQLDSKGFN